MMFFVATIYSIFVDSTNESPPLTIKEGENIIPNHDFALRARQDKTILGAILTSLSKEVGTLVFAIETSKEA